MYCLKFFKKKIITQGKQRICGKNNSGKIVVYHRGGSCKRLYRIVDLKKYIWNCPGILLTTIYDANRTAALHLILYVNGVITCSLATENKRIGSTIINKISNKAKIGETRFLYNITSGTKICSVELQKYKGMQFLRTAYNFCILLTTIRKFCVLRLKARRFFINSYEMCGLIGKIQVKTCLLRASHTNYAKFSIRKGIRPCVRGVAKNPIDHPHGGGQGKTSGGRPSVTPWAQITKGKKTRKKFVYNTFKSSLEESEVKQKIKVTITK